MQQTKTSPAKRAKPKPIRPSTGRPTREQAEQRHEELMSCALDIFLERGFEQTTIEEIAIAVGMSKRTVYARYEDKAALFKAAVARAIELYTVPPETVRAQEGGSLEETLINIANMRIENLKTPNATRLQRILATQSYRFPDLLQTSYEVGAGPTIVFLAELFERLAQKGEIEAENPRWMAGVFMSMTTGGPARRIIAGDPIDESETAARIKDAVRLFLNGARKR